MRFVRYSILTTCLLATSSLAQAQNIIYQHNFGGLATTPLHGLNPDVDNSGAPGGAKWVTRTDTGLPDGEGREWYADGHIDTTLEPNRNGSAALPFTPSAGKIYALTTRVNSIFTEGGDAFSWLGVGFSSGMATGDGGGAEFFGNGHPDQITGQPWMMARADNSVHPNITALGPGVDGIANWTAPVTDAGGGPVDLRILLDTTAPAWSVEFQAKKPTDATFTSVGLGTYATNPTILAIALGGNFNIGGSVDSISLTVVPEPGAALLLTLGLGAVSMVRR